MRPFSKDFFDLQVSFAQKICALSGRPLESALLDYTNFYVRLGLGRRYESQHPSWQAYLAGLRDAEDIRDWTYRFYLDDPEVSTMPPVVATFGCFSYAVEGANRARLHFRNVDGHSHSPLGRARSEQRRAELTELFAHVRRSVSADSRVIGASWLYNLEAYRRLFPVSYALSARVVRGRFRSMSLWGQFADHEGGLKAEVAVPFLNALAQLSNVAEADACFPFQVLAVEAPLERFHEFYET